MAKIFERYRFLSLAFEYRPLVGTQTAGSVTMGVDWITASLTMDYDDETDDIVLTSPTVVSKPDILALTPSMDGPVWQRTKRMTVPKSMLQNRLWYDSSTPGQGAVIPDYAPGYLASMSTESSYGEVWVHYKVHFNGTRKA